MIFEDQVTSYADFDTTVNRVASGFRRLGISAGDRVCVMLSNCPEFPYAWFGLMQMLYAQVVKTICRRRLVRVTHRVVFGTFDRVNHVLAACGMGWADMGGGKGCLIYPYSPV